MSGRALFLAPIYPPQVGGAAVHFEQLTRELTTRGTLSKAYVLTATADGAPRVQRDRHVTVLRFLFAPGEINGRFRRWKLAWNYATVLFVVIACVLFRRVSVVHTQTKRYFEWGCRAARLLGASVLVDGRDLGAPTFGCRGEVFVACSRNVADRAADRSEPVELVPVGIDQARLEVRPDPVRAVDEPYVLFVGDIARRKGVDALQQGFEMADLGWTLVLVGEAIDPSLLPADRTDVVYLGACPHDRVLQYIENAELVVLPSREEALGRVALEAFHAGTPVLCPPTVPEFEEHVPEYVISEITPEAIATALAAVANRSSSLEHAYPIERHYLSNTIRQYESLYASL